MNKQRILIVDDEGGAARLLKANLEATERYEVCVENWAENAVETARQFHPDLVLLDVFMPRLMGGDVAAAFKADPQLRHAVIVFLTAAVRRSRVAEHEGVISGDPIIAKPADIQEIIRTIETYLPWNVPAVAAGPGADPSRLHA